MRFSTNNPYFCLSVLALLTFIASGCENPTETALTDSPEEVIDPVRGTSTSLVDPSGESETAPDAVFPINTLTYEELIDEIDTDDAKLTLIDCWASWCGPCKENFHHVLAMHDAYSEDGLNVIALSFDAGTGRDDLDDNQISAAAEFLAEKDAGRIKNYRLTHSQLEMFDKFDIITIPAVFLLNADGEEIARFTYDDPENQFTYEQVEKAVAEQFGIDSKGVVEPETEDEG